MAAESPGPVTPAISRSRRRAVAIGGLVLATVGAALALTSFDAEVGSGIYADPQQPSQWATCWRLGAVFAYTSGSFIGHICALVAGFLCTRWWSPRDGVLVGTGIGVANVAASALLALPATTGDDAWYAEYVDPLPFHQPAVLGAMAAVLGMAIIMAGLGAIAARLADGHPLTLIPPAAGVAVVHLAGTMWLAQNAWLLGGW